MSTPASHLREPLIRAPRGSLRGWMLPWTVLLLVGYVLVLALGAPVPTAAEELEAAYHPAAPVTEAAARASAATIIRLSYPELREAEPAVERRTDFDIERWLLVYTQPEQLAGVRVSIRVSDGQVTVTSFP